jgi:hypothetical protein
MTVAQENIVKGQTLTNALVTYYTAPALKRARICNATLTNDSGGAVACSVYIISSGGTAKKIKLRPVADGETYTCPELIGQILEPGSYIQALGLAVNFDVSAFTQV